MSDRSPDLRLRQGLVLLAGAVLFAILVGPDADNFYLVPLGVGLIYLAAAAAGGRDGGYWATAVVLVGWGLAVVWVREGNPDLDTAGLYLLGAGLGAIAGVLLARRGFAVDPLGLATTVALAGLVLAFAAQWSEVLEDARTYALLVGLVGLVNVAIGGAGGRGRGTPAG
jgi:hypothetical protein